MTLTGEGGRGAEETLLLVSLIFFFGKIRAEKQPPPPPPPRVNCAAGINLLNLFTLALQSEFTRIRYFCVAG